MSWADVSQDLLLRYDVQGPRYTSYPTAPVWTSEFGPDDWHAALRRADADAGVPLSLYVHVPYCHSMCLFCGCSVIVTMHEERAPSYVDLVLAEAAHVAEALPRRRTLGQHHWGGGTPTYLPPDEIARLYEGLRALFPPSDDAEISIEVDPRVTTEEQLKMLRRLGFNRLSMGIQDFTPEVQQAVHRIQSREQTGALIETARELGFGSINVDLIYGLPYQQLETFEKTLDTVTDWGVDRVACYSYAYVPWLKKHQNAISKDALPSRGEKFALLRLALEHFGASGYEAIGFDHFARPDDSLAVASREGRLHRNFQGYSTRMGGGRSAEDMIALGMTSIGDVAGAFGQNRHTFPEWRDAVEAGRFAVHRGWLRTAGDEERRRVILDLMCHYGLRYADYDRDGEPPFTERYRSALDALRPMQDDGLVTIDDDAVRVTSAGRLFLRNLCMPFDAYLEQQAKDGKPIFSRTV